MSKEEELLQGIATGLVTSPSLETALRQACRAVVRHLQAASACIALLEDDMLRPSPFFYGLTPSQRAALKGLECPLAEHPWLRQVVGERRPLFLADHQGNPRVNQTMRRLFSSCAALAAPLSAAGEVQGVLFCNWEEGTALEEPQLRLVSRVADMLGHALHCTRGSQRTQILAQSLNDLVAATLAVARQDTPQRALQTIVDEARTIIGAQYGALVVRGEQGQVAEFITSGISQQRRRTIGKSPSARGLFGLVLEQGQTLRLRDLRQHPRFSGFPPHHPEMTSLLAVPVGDVGQHLGYLYLTNKWGGPFTQEDENLVRLFAQEVATILKRTTLLNQFQAVHSVLQAAAESLDLKQTLEGCLRAIVEVSSADAAEIWLLDRQGTSLTLAHHVSAYQEVFLERTQFALGEGFPGIVAQSGEPLLVHNLQKEPRFLRQRIKDQGFQTFCAVPIRQHGEILGALCAAAMDPESLTSPQEIALLGHVANACGTSIANSRLHTDLEEAHREALIMLATAAEARDAYTGQHLRRLEALTRLLALKLGFPPKEAEELGRSAITHDIGKIHLPLEVLGKPGSLSEVEWVVIRQHPLYGEEILGTHPRFALARQIARSHHERWDGSGYPDGLKGEEIPLAARIVAVADVYDALTSERPYKRAWSQEDALAEIHRQAGSHFDPQVVAALEALWQEGVLTQLREEEQESPSPLWHHP